MNTSAILKTAGHAEDISEMASSLLMEKNDGNLTEFEVFIPEISKDKRYLIVKRAFDVSVSIVAIILLAIPMIIIAILIRFDSPGPALFRQERLGKDGRSFTILKFRTMQMDAEKEGPQWTVKADPRCTRLGKKLRQSHMDEIPQLWNILKGEMSFVGPRPERACFYEKFETYIHGFSKRFLVKPGLTGYAQVNGGYELKPEEKIVYDIAYIKGQSIALDLWCMFKTVKLVFTHEGAR